MYKENTYTLFSMLEFSIRLIYQHRFLHTTYFPMQEAIMNTVFLIYSAYQKDSVFYDDKKSDGFSLACKRNTFML